MPDLTIPVLFLIHGLVYACMAVFAHEIGLDPNAAWGRSRFFLFSVGTILVAISVLLVYFRKNKDNFFISSLQSSTAKILFSVGHVWLIIFLIYIWFITYGNWNTWNRTSNYYDQLANSFRKGQLNIDIEPGEAFLAIPDPYDPASRPAFNSDIWDMSLYKGKFYLYWGPLPALLITPIKFFSDTQITDNYLVFFFFAGLLIFNSLIILKLWRKFFADVSAWNMLVCIAAAGLITPILWSMNSPRVYEAAIGAGQFFLVGGIFFALSAFDQNTKVNRAQLFLAGLFWACSVGARAINALSVIFFVGLIAFWVVKNEPRQMMWRRLLPEMTALMIPLVAGAVAIAWYNWARFASPLEFGFKYAITILDLNKLSHLVFHPGYFFLNLYVYLFQPFELVSTFPFIQPGTLWGHLSQLNIVMPHIYFAGRMTGLLFCAPFLVLSLVHLRSNFRPAREEKPSGNLLSYDFAIYLLAGSFMINFLSLLFFFFGQMRYLVDVISQVTLLAILGYWKILSSRESWKPVQAKLVPACAHLLVAITICAGLLLAFSSDYDRFKTLNPVLFERIAEVFTFQE